MRKMVTVRKIDDVQPIENADAIEKAVVGGWDVVVKKLEINRVRWRVSDRHQVSQRLALILSNQIEFAIAFPFQ